MTPKNRKNKSTEVSVESRNSGGSYLLEDFNISDRLERIIWDTAGVLLFAAGFMTLLALIFPSKNGVILDWWIHVLQLWFGWGTVWIVLLLFIGGLWVLLYKGYQKNFPVKWRRIFALELVAFVSLGLLSLYGGFSLFNAEAGIDGGRIGWGLAQLIQMALNTVGLSALYWSQIILVGLLFIGILIGSGISKILRVFKPGMKSPIIGEGSYVNAAGVAVSEAPIPGQESALAPVKSVKKKRAVLPPEFRKRFTVEKVENIDTAADHERNELLPELDLLTKERSSRPDERNINMTAGLIEKTLSEFGIPVKVVGFKVGPTVTQFAIEPGYLEKDNIPAEGDAERQKIRVAQISGLRKDLALALSAERLRIEAPVPGRPYVGIEVPNPKASIVRLRPILESEAFYAVGSQLSIVLGRDVSGLPIVGRSG